MLSICYNFAHLDAIIVLSKGLADKGIYPNVDPLDSTSAMLRLIRRLSMSPTKVGLKSTIWYKVAMIIKKRSFMLLKTIVNAIIAKCLFPTNIRKKNYSKG